MSMPGAATSGLTRESRVGPPEEKPARLNPSGTCQSEAWGSLIAPTVVAYLATPGELTVAAAGPAFPAATNGVRPAAASLLVSTDVVSVPCVRPVDEMLMLTRSIPYVALLASTHSIPASTAACSAPHSKPTLTDTIAAPGATPRWAG